VNGTIICAVDDSEGVDAAVRVALRIAERFDARILVVSIAEGDGRAPAEHELPEEEHRVAVGDPVESVTVIAAEEAADLIVVGARRGRLGRSFRSSLASELASSAPCPVVVAPPEAAQVVSGRSSPA